MEAWFEQSPLLRLFVLIGLGYLLGEIRLWRGVRLGVAAVLFVGIAIGWGFPKWVLPHEIQILGLVLFVYCIGLDAGPGFWRSFAGKGLIANVAVLVGLTLAVLIAWAIATTGFIDRWVLVGVLIGSWTNTPALGAATDAVHIAGASSDAASRIMVGFGCAYPVAVISILAWLSYLYRGVKKTGSDSHHITPPAPAVTLRITYLNQQGSWTVGEAALATGLVFSRVRHPDGSTVLATPETVLELGALVIAVGSAQEIAKGIEMLGEESAESFADDLGGFARHRYFVSNSDIVGRPLAELDLAQRGFLVTRVRRGDVDLRVTPQLELKLGDRVRVVSRDEKEPSARLFFGNSLGSMTETGYLSFALGIVLGLLVGMIAIPVPGLPLPIKLGVAGGPLLVALIMGRLGRTGPIIWHVPYSTNVTLRHFGLLLFLACVGVKAGAGLAEGITPAVWRVLLVAVSLWIVPHAVLFLTLCWRRSAATSTASGMASGLQTQPAAFGFAMATDKSTELGLAYTTVYPMALVAKIVLAQVLVVLLAL
ncbi:MAG: TrkA C-terminal domain-containing protein [Blastochloris sp.]|nr:TrkA C-terminal domain-containing protein [Blastochloris sp.]